MKYFIGHFPLLAMTMIFYMIIHLLTWILHFSCHTRGQFLSWSQKTTMTTWSTHWIWWNPDTILLIAQCIINLVLADCYTILNPLVEICSELGCLIKLSLACWLFNKLSRSDVILCPIKSFLFLVFKSGLVINLILET